MIRKFLPAIFSLIFPISVLAIILPSPTGFVNDFASVLSPAVESELQSDLNNFKRDSRIEIVAAVVSSLEGMPENVYAENIYKEWKIGDSVDGRGALILIAPIERSMWIYLGNGLRDDVSDMTLNEIIDDYILPSVKNGDFDTAVKNGVKALEAASLGQMLPSLSSGGVSGASGGSAKTGFIIFAVIIAIVVGLAVLNKKKGGKLGGDKLKKEDKGTGSGLAGPGKTAGGGGAGARW